MALDWLWNHSIGGKMSQSVIVDACGWVAIIDSGVNFELELEKTIGTFQLILLTEVLDELKDLEGKRPKRRSLLINMLLSKSRIMTFVSESSNHTDDLIFQLATENSYKVLTVDKELKKRLYQSGIDVIEIVKNKHLSLIEGL